MIPPVGGTATAFCVDARGLFLTNAHVVAGVPPGGKLHLMLDPGGPGRQHVEARVLSVNAEMDLALLQADGLKGLAVLEFGTIPRWRRPWRSPMAIPLRVKSA